MKKHMMNTNPSYASPLPTLSEKDFPSLGKSSEPEKLETLLFKRYLIIKDNSEKTENTNTDNAENKSQTKTKKEKVSELTVFEVDKHFQQVLGKQYKWCKVSRLRSGLLLIEVVQKQTFDKLKHIKKWVRFQSLL